MEQTKTTNKLKLVRIPQEFHAILKAEQRRTHRELWAIVADAMRSGLKQLKLIDNEDYNTI